MYKGFEDVSEGPVLDPQRRQRGGKEASTAMPRAESFRLPQVSL